MLRPVAVIVALNKVCQTLVQVANNNVLHQQPLLAEKSTTPTTLLSDRPVTQSDTICTPP